MSDLSRSRTAWDAFISSFALAKPAPATRRLSGLHVLIAVFILASLLVLRIRSLIPPDEGRYAEMAREMLLSGDWITTRLDGIKYFEKPPLHIWMSTLSFALFGLGEWQARLWNALCGIGTVLMVGYTGRRVFGGRGGLYAAAILGSMVFWTAASQFNTLDISVSATMCMALCALLLAQRDAASTAERRNWMLACWAGMALSLLAKGLIGLVLPGAVLVLYALISGDRAILRRLCLARGLGLFLLMALPWFCLVAIRNPEQPHFFFVHEHWDRFFLKTHHREGPWYYFLVLLVPATLPWLPLLPASLKQAWQGAGGKFQAAKLLLIWIVFILLFFSYSSSKLPGYTLPVFPAMALLMGACLERASPGLAMSPAILLALTGIAGLALMLIGSVLTLSPADAAWFVGMRPLLTAAFLAAFVFGLAGWLALRRDQRLAMVLSVAIGAWLLTQLAMSAYEPLGRRQSGKDLALAVRAQIAASTPVYSVGTYEQSMTFYLRHTVIPVQYEDELAFGLQQEPERGIPTMAEFDERWQRGVARGEPQFAIVRADLYPELLARKLPMRLRAGNGSVVVVSAP